LQLAHTCPLGVLVLGPQEQVLFANARAQALVPPAGQGFGFKNEQRQDLPSSAALWESLRSGQPDQALVLWQAPDGRDVWLVLRHEKHFVHPEAHWFWVQDITQTYQAERIIHLLNACLEEAHEPIVVCDAFLKDSKPHIVYANAAFSQLTGKGKQELLEQEIDTLVLPESREALQKSLQAVYHAQRPMSCEISMQADKRKKVPFVKTRWQMTPLCALSSDKPAYFVCVLQDLSFSGNTVQTIANQKDHALNQFVYGISHDFNNILGIIRVCIDLLATGISESHPQHPYLETMRAACTRGAHLVHSFMAVKKGSPQMPRSLHVPSIVKGLEPVLRVMFGSSIVLSMHLNPETPAIIATVSEIESIVLNLCTNSRDAMPHGGIVHVTVDVMALPGQIGPHVLLCVADTGQGIAPEVQKRIFDPHFSTKDKDKNQGLGLATVASIVQALGGKIEVASYPQQGSVFKVMIPCAAL
jgi:PAS domain S-box-containing protein